MSHKLIRKGQIYTRRVKPDELFVMEDVRCDVELTIDLDALFQMLGAASLWRTRETSFAWLW